MRRQGKRKAGRSREATVQDREQRAARDPEKVDWESWLEHWETWNAIVADVKPPSCGLFGCDERIKVGNKWKCVACGKITDDQGG